MSARRDRSTAGRCSSCSRRSGPTSGSAPRCSCRSIFVVVLLLQDGRPERRPARPLHPRDRLATPVRRALLHVDLGVPADHGARRRRHRRLREPQRHAEDDPHPLARPRRDLRRQGARLVHLHGRGRLRDGPSSASSPAARLGLPPAHLALGHEGLAPGTGSCCSPRASASTCCRSPAIAAFGLLLSTVTRNSAAAVVGTLMFALLMQLLGVLPGTEAIRPYLLGTQFDAWHGFLRVPADWAPVVRALWVCALYIAVPLVRGVPRLPAPRRRRRLSRPRCLTPPPGAS